MSVKTARRLVTGLAMTFTALVITACVASSAPAPQQAPAPMYEWKPMLVPGMEYAVDVPAQVVFFKHVSNQNGGGSASSYVLWFLTALPCSQTKGLCER